MARHRIGMLTPSSNTVVEPATNAIVSQLADVSAHFSRFTVTEISLTDKALGQFDNAPFMEAARLLSHAKMHVIAWNGTSAAWRGFHEDEALCAQFAADFGVKATASMLALNTIMSARGATRFGLVTPYIDDVQNAIITNYQGANFDVIAERHSGIKVNFDFSQIPEQDIRNMTLEVAESKPPAIMIVCTNLPSAHLVEDLEQQTGIPIYDSTSAVVWHALRLAGIDTSGIAGYGSLFTDPILNALAFD